MESVDHPSDRRDVLEAAYERALAEYREWDRRAVEAMSCDIATAAQVSLERLRRLDARRARTAQN